MRIVLVFFLFAYCDFVCAQQPDSTAASLSTLKSPDVQQRLDAYEKIIADKEAMKRSDVKAALVDLLDRENQMMHKTPADRGEGYAEYIGELLGTVADIANWHDHRQLCILAESPYNPDSQFAGRLAEQGGAAVAPCLLKMTQGSMSDRYESIPVLVQLSAVTKVLSTTVRQEIRKETIAGLRDSDTRSVTVLALEKFGTAEMIPNLQEIARSDQYSRLLENGQRRFDIREAATRAVQSIQERAKAQ